MVSSARERILNMLREKQRVKSSVSATELFLEPVAKSAPVPVIARTSAKLREATAGDRPSEGSKENAQLSGIAGQKRTADKMLSESEEEPNMLYKRKNKLVIDDNKVVIDDSDDDDPMVSQEYEERKSSTTNHVENAVIESDKDDPMELREYEATSFFADDSRDLDYEHDELLHHRLVNQQASAYYLQHGCMACDLDPDLACKTNVFPCPDCVKTGCICMPKQRPTLTPEDGLAEIIANVEWQA